MNRTLYVYDSTSGLIGYTVENVSRAQLTFYENRNIPHFVSETPVNLRGTYVVLDDNGAFSSVAPRQHFSIGVTHGPNNPLIANGTDNIIFSDIPDETEVTVGNPFNQKYVSDGSDPTLEFTANGISGSNVNVTVSFRKYGYYPSDHYIPLWVDAWAGDANVG
tara:strand:+ start:3179 stop:3667 length:489 start_codon:yes stop_codon:yes gene_type:complete